MWGGVVLARALWTKGYIRRHTFLLPCNPQPIDLLPLSSILLSFSPRSHIFLCLASYAIRHRSLFKTSSNIKLSDIIYHDRREPNQVPTPTNVSSSTCCPLDRSHYFHASAPGIRSHVQVTDLRSKQDLQSPLPPCPTRMATTIRLQTAPRHFGARLLPGKRSPTSSVAVTALLLPNPPTALLGTILVRSHQQQLRQTNAASH